MINNYKILITNHDKYKNIKLNNINVSKDNNNTSILIHFTYIKLIVVLLLLFFVKLKLNHLSKSYDLESYEIDKITNDENQENAQIKLRRNIFWNFTFLKNEMHSYELYNTFKFPQISLILMNNEKPQQNIYKIINYIKILVSQNLTNIEIILCIFRKNKNDYNSITKELNKLIKNDVLKVYLKIGDIEEDYSNIINLIKGSYTIFINNNNLIENIQFQNLFELSLDKTSNYFFFQTSNNTKIYVIKTKILKDLIDSGITISSFNMILENIESFPPQQFNYIHIALCPDNSFTNLAYVTMTSILSSKSFNTYICFYLIIPKNFEEKNVNFIQTLHEEYDYFNITFIKMDERYNKAYTDRRITTQAYYRFSLGKLIPYLNKIIYFDTDIIVYKDLSNFYNLNFNGKMILGQPTYGNKNSQKHGFHRINTGILLLNLVEMRKNKLEEKVIEIINKGIKLRYHDQTLLNDYFKKYLGIFPPEYHTRPWSNYKEMEIFNKKIGNAFDQDYFYFAHKYPTIRHFLGGYKPRNKKVNYIEDWWFFARKSKYYNKSANTYLSAFSFL